MLNNEDVRRRHDENLIVQTEEQAEGPVKLARHVQHG